LVFFSPRSSIRSLGTLMSTASIFPQYLFGVRVIKGFFGWWLQPITGKKRAYNKLLVIGRKNGCGYFTVTLFASFLGLSGSVPLSTVTW
jgi:hypothetical protein